MSRKVHPTAIVAAGAELADDVEIGPYAIIGEGVRLGTGTTVGAHASIEGPAELGEGNRVFPHAALGFAPQDLKYHGEPTRLVVGSGNVFREFVTVHRGTPGGLAVTTIGDHNYFMSGSHVAHDGRVGSRCVFANGAAVAGHVEVGDFVILSAFSGAHQFVRIGSYAFVGGYTPMRQDVLPFCKTDGADAKTYGLNTVGLKRNGFSEDRIEALQKAYRLLVKSKLNTSQALERIEKELPHQTDVRDLVEFIRSSQRGFHK